jgi:hypothetical protein
MPGEMIAGMATPPDEGAGFAQAGPPPPNGSYIGLQAAGPTPEMMSPTSFASPTEVMPEEVATQIRTDGEAQPPDVVGQLPALMAPTLIDCKLRVPIRKGRLRIEAVPPEHFFIAGDAVTLDETIPACGRVYYPMRSDLVKWGYDPDVIDELPAHTYSLNSPERSARERTSGEFGINDIMHHAAERVEIWEWFPLIDMDGDGIAERLRVVIADKVSYKDGSRRVLEWAPWEDDLPFTDIVPDPVPHRWRGRSIFDETEDLQRIGTVLLRAFLDNLYWANNPRTKGPLGQVLNKDEVYFPTFGGHIDTPNPDAIQPIVIPYVGDRILQGIDLVDRKREYRTGVSAATQGLDADVLQNQTATAVNAAQAAARSKVEEYARNIKEVGLPRFFSCLLRLVVKHTDKPDVIRLRDKWEEVDPRHWNADMDVVINTGLGTGNRERDAAAMQVIIAEQDKFIQFLGMDNPAVGLEEAVNSRQALAEALNIRSTEQFFREVNAEDIARMKANKQPSPEELKLQLEAQKVQAEQQIQMTEIDLRNKAEQKKAQIDIWKAEQAAQIEVQMTREQAAIALQTAREKMAFELQKHREQIEAEYAIKQREWEWEFLLEKERANTKMTEERTELGGDPG